ncbi:cellulase family glycosylhydrolase [uncultured Fibrobacter sp.]|uniref:cellulase family glycosylhydrolase n=1 Tax=uncultured Fibrobacter sp. TaxID=261512 RepID=UPI0028047BCA|nr:cellulase family glycosylhydrolase [uncultured Fibrobacter sp.]
MKFCVLLAGIAVAATFSFGRVGPVSQYGQLQAGKNTNGAGRIYGSCPAYSTSGNEVQVQGMSLFWSIAADVGTPFWTSDIVSGLVEKQNIQLIRAPMGVDEDWGSGNYFTDSSYYQGLMNTVVQAAISNDIYVIIDYHSHKANENVENAKTFFKYMAEKWGKYDNVIFEVFNEPKEQSWGTIKSYADQVISVIRQYSDNLIIVGSRNWDQYPNEAISNPISDKNVAYTFHYYAGSHYTNKEGANAVTAMNAGLSVFVSEWGTVDASGNGGFNSSNSATWLNWMNNNKLSGANWSVSNKDESASYFNGSAWNYSESGNWVNTNVFSKLPTSYKACSGVSVSSSSTASSSSSIPAGYTDYIDDFEDGDSLAFTGGVWYAYTDKGDAGQSSISNTPNVDKDGVAGYDVVFSADNGTQNMAGLKKIVLSQGGNKYEPYVALGVKLNADESAYNLSKCTTISYKYKGAAHNFKAEDVNVSDYGYHYVSKLVSDSWTTVNLSWSQLNQPSWAEEVTLSKARINKFTWEIKGDLKGTQPSYNYLYVDDVRCNGMAIKPVLPSSSSSGKSSSSAVSSSSAKPSSSSAVSSSSAKPSSSSAVSSSSAKPSSSSISTSFIVDGDLNQTIEKGSAIRSVTITNVASFERQTWNLSSVGNITVEYSGTTVVISGSVGEWASVDNVTESFKINGEAVQFNLAIAEKGSGESSSSSNEQPGSSSSESTGFVANATASSLSVVLVGRSLEIAGATAVDVDVFDMQGRLLERRLQVNGSVSLHAILPGSYIVRVRSASANWTRRISIR